MYRTTLLLVASCLVMSCQRSSDDLCDEACSIWDSCEQVEGNTVNYPYDTCFEECKDEGDWGRSYVNCLEDQDTCPELGNQCG